MYRYNILRICMLFVAALFCPADAMSQLPVVVENADIGGQLERLDAEVAARHERMQSQIMRIDSLKSIVEASSPVDSAAIFSHIAYENFYLFPDTALVYYGKILGRKQVADDEVWADALHNTISLLAANGMIKLALDAFDFFMGDSIPDDMYPLYYKTGKDMYSLIARHYSSMPELHSRYVDLSMDMRKRYIRYIEPGSVEWAKAEAEQMYEAGNYVAAYTAGVDALDLIDEDDREFSALALLIAEAYRRKGREKEAFYYLVRAAVSELKCVKPYGVALQLVGHDLYYHGDYDRAHRYMSAALENVSANGVGPRMGVMMKSLMLIDSSYIEKSRRNTLVVWIVAVTLALFAAVSVFMVVKYRRVSVRYNDASRRHVQVADVRVAYVKNFLDLCAMSTRRLNGLCRLANQKIAANQVAQLYDITRSGRIMEEQRKEIMLIFDEAFLGLYPDFVNKLNSLLREDERYEISDDGRLPAELRIYAFVWLGMDDVNKMADFLSYSVNTVYSYRVKVKSKAIDRDNFDRDFMTLVNGK